jgi:glycine cleavage system H protein
MGDQAAVVESVKAAAEVYAPITGEIAEVNEDLANKPELVNEDPTGDGWFFKMSIDDESELDSLMDEKEYAAFVKDLD